MQKNIILPTGIWKKLGELWKLLESRDINHHTAIQKEFDNTPIDDEELVPLVKAYIDKWFINNGNELILGSSDFLPIQVLDKGRIASQAVCCLLQRFNEQNVSSLIELASTDGRVRGIAAKLFSEKDIPVDPIEEPEKFKQQALSKKVPTATGFLIGQNYLITNRHVIEDVLRNPPTAKIDDFSVAFGYERNLEDSVIYQFSTDSIIAQSQSLDYVLLKLQPDQHGQNAGEKFPPIPLGTVDVIPTPTKGVLQKIDKPVGLSDDAWAEIQARGLSGDLVNIIQHPEGRSKEIVIFNNRLVEIYEDFLLYEADAQPGSSGSPLFNARWELIGLHQAALLDRDTKQVFGYLGIRMSSIIENLRSQAKETEGKEIRDFLESLKPKKIENSTYKVFIFAGQNRSSILGKQYAELEQKAMQKCQEKIQDLFDSNDENIHIELIPGLEMSLSEAIPLINEKSRLFSETSIAIQLVADFYPKNPNAHGVAIYYQGGDDAGLAYANSLLKGIRQQSPETPIFKTGVYPDRQTNTKGLKFCRQTKMPAVVLFAGFLSNERDYARLTSLQTQPDEFAQAIASGIRESVRLLRQTGVA